MNKIEYAVMHRTKTCQIRLNI